jgi:hypothetical protein
MVLSPRDSDRVLEQLPELYAQSGSTENLYSFLAPHDGPGAPQARPPKRRGNRGDPASEGVGGSAGAKPPGSKVKPSS